MKTAITITARTIRKPTGIARPAASPRWGRPEVGRSSVPQRELAIAMVMGRGVVVTRHSAIAADVPAEAAAASAIVHDATPVRLVGAWSHYG